MIAKALRIAATMGLGAFLSACSGSAVQYDIRVDRRAGNVLYWRSVGRVDKRSSFLVGRALDTEFVGDACYRVRFAPEANQIVAATPRKCN